MTDQVQINIDLDLYNRLQTLMVPPNNDANAVIKELLYHEGHASRSVLALEAAEKHYSYAEELERSNLGIYECGGGT